MILNRNEQFETNKMKTLILNARIVNENDIKELDLLIENGLITQIEKDLQHIGVDEIIDAENLYLLPGIIDDQVHFREPGLTQKATIATESQAAVTGGVTSFMEMPNVVPPTTNMEAIKQKISIAQSTSFANFSFYIGATNDNITDLLALDDQVVCGVKVFMGASTGSLLVDDINALHSIFSSVKVPIVTHCEDNETILQNYHKAKAKYGDEIPVSMHPSIRSADACEKSTRLAISLAQEYGSDLHVLHISTAQELKLFSNAPIEEKRITAEVCVHHLWFNQDDYSKLGNLIKCNPAIKTKFDQQALIEAVNSNKLDIIATDHAPHTIEEKMGNYSKAPAGIPLVQHSLLSLIDHFKKGKLTLETIVEKACHNPAILFEIKDRGYIREGFFADLVIIDLDKYCNVKKSNILYKCGWSPFENITFKGIVEKTFVNGHLAYNKGKISKKSAARALTFDR